VLFWENPVVFKLLLYLTIDYYVYHCQVFGSYQDVGSFHVIELAVRQVDSRYRRVFVAADGEGIPALFARDVLHVDVADRKVPASPSP